MPCYLANIGTLECSKQLQLEYSIRVVNALLSCDIETLLECSKHIKFECCIWVVKPIFQPYRDTTRVLQTPSIGVSYQSCKCPIILSYRYTTRLLQTPSLGVFYQSCKCPIILPSGDTTRVIQTPSIGVLYQGCKCPIILPYKHYQSAPDTLNWSVVLGLQMPYYLTIQGF